MENLQKKLVILVAFMEYILGDYQAVKEDKFEPTDFLILYLCKAFKWINVKIWHDIFRKEEIPPTAPL